MTFDQLAEQVSLSSSATLRRVRRLEESGVISGYVALVRAEKVGLGLTAYLNYKGFPICQAAPSQCESRERFTLCRSDFDFRPPSNRDAH